MLKHLETSTCIRYSNSGTFHTLHSLESPLPLSPSPSHYPFFPNLLTHRLHCTTYARTHRLAPPHTESETNSLCELTHLRIHKAMASLMALRRATTASSPLFNRLVSPLRHSSAAPSVFRSFNTNTQMREYEDDDRAVDVDRRSDRSLTRRRDAFPSFFSGTLSFFLC